MTKLGEFSFTLLCVLLLAASAPAQSSQREALDFDGDNKADYLIFRSGNSVWFVQESGGEFGMKILVLVFPLKII